MSDTDEDDDDTDVGVKRRSWRLSCVTPKKSSIGSVPSAENRGE